MGEDKGRVRRREMEGKIEDGEREERGKERGDEGGRREMIGRVGRG